jgi:hypothetical protein
MRRVILADVYSKDGDLVRIEAVDPADGEAVLDFLWDPRDEQTPENRESFRRWADTWLKRKGYETRG